MQANTETSTPVSNPLERRLDLAVTIADLEKDVEQRLKRMGRNVKLAGFRPGKVPFSVLKQHYGEQARAEALTEALDRVFAESVQTQKLRVAGYPHIEPKVPTASTLEFTAVFEIFPEFSIADVSSELIEKPLLEVTQVEIDKTLDILRKQRATFADADRPAAANDRVIIDFIGKKEGVPFQGGQANDYPFVLGQGAMLPDFEAAVTGMKPAESKSFDLTFPADYFSKDLAGQTVQFEVTVKSVQVSVLPEVDTDFAESLGIAGGDLNKMRAEIEGNLKREVKKRLIKRLKDQVMDVLVKTNPIPLPAYLVNMEVERLVKAAREDMAQRGMENKNMPIQPEWFTEQASRRVSLGLILAELVKTEGLQATPAMVKSKVEENAQSYEDPDEIVRWFYAQPQR